MGWVENEMGQTMSRFEIVDVYNADELINFIQTLDSNTEKQFTHFRGLGQGPIMEKINRKTHNFFLRIDDKLAGYGFLQHKNEWVASFGLVVGPAYQKQGYGQIMLRYILGEAKRIGYKKVWGGCYTDNWLALKLYKKLGFVCEGVFMKEEWDKDEWRHLYSLAKFFDKYEDTQAAGLRAEYLSNKT